MELISEIWQFLKLKKKIWMFPLIAAMLVLATLLFLAQGSVMAPFIYTIF